MAGGTSDGVLVLWALVFPALLLALLVAMEKLEARVALGDLRLALLAQLESGRPDDVEVFVARRFGPALEDHWRRWPRRARSS